MTCACGCGKAINPGRRYARGHNKHTPQKTIWCQMADGRWVVIGRKGRIHVWARIVMRNHLGRELERSEVVHHLNRDATDDRIENLAVMTQSEHMKLHHATGTSYALTDADRARAKAGVAARKATRTHCRNGHPLDEANTRWDPNGRRVCRACKRESQRARRAVR